MSRFPTLVWAFAGTVSAFLLILECSTQGRTSPAAPQSAVALTKLSPPVYPHIALQARVTGDVELMLGIRQDGTVDSAVVISGPPLLQRAALTSAQQSRFECRNCGGAVTEYRLLYTFRVDVLNEVRCTAPEDCGKSAAIHRGPEVTQSENQITLTNQVVPMCICDAFRKVRSAKCLYLWRCGVQ